MFQRKQRSDQMCFLSSRSRLFGQLPASGSKSSYVNWQKNFATLSLESTVLSSKCMVICCHLQIFQHHLRPISTIYAPLAPSTPHCHLESPLFCHLLLQLCHLPVQPLWVHLSADCLILCFLQLRVRFRQITVYLFLVIRTSFGTKYCR